MPPVVFAFLRMAALLVALELLVAPGAEVRGADWRFYGKSAYGSYHYDAENIAHLPAHCVRVWQRLVLSSDGTTTLARELGKEYENASEIVLLREMDCAGKKGRILELISSSAEGTVIRRESYQPLEWDPVVPGSVDDDLCQAVCR